MSDHESIDLTVAFEIRARYDCQECGRSHVHEEEETLPSELPGTRDCPHCGGSAQSVYSFGPGPAPATLDCGHPDCDTSLSMTGEELMETTAWKNGMGRGCAVEEIREKSGWTGDGWRVFCPEHADWAEDPL